MPEQIRLKVGGVTVPQMAVYEEFARNIPGFLPLSEREAAAFVPKPAPAPELPAHPAAPFQAAQSSLAADDAAALCEKLAVEVDQFAQATGGQAAFATMNANMLVLRDCLMHAFRNRDIVTSHAIVQKVGICLSDLVFVVF